jgi:parallel beta-helix repeat protein
MKTHYLVVWLFCIATPLTFSTSASAQTTDWTFCASEGGVCTFSGRQEVRYGASGLYVYRTLTNSTECTNKVFGGDPAPGVAKSCSLQTTVTTPPPTGEWSVCAQEGGFCAFSGTQQVRYGANGLYVYKSLSGGTACTNTVFGDPAPGVPKQCSIPATSTTSTWSVCASEGGFCAFSGTTDVRYGANGAYFYRSLFGGTACTNSVFGDPAPGVVKQCSIGGTAATLTTSPPPTSTSSYGPRSTITCPSGAAHIWPGSSIQTVVNNHPAGTTYCLRAGVHSLTSSITPKRGDTFVGEYGATLDGSGWSSSDDTQAAFRAHNQDIDYVTIRNFVIRNMPQKGIHAYYWMSDHWTIEYNEIAHNKWGVEFAPNFTLTGNYIHHNVGNPSASNPAERGGGYVGNLAHNTTFDSNEIAYNGPEQKVGASSNVTFRNNFVHHNLRDGIWYDTSTGGGALIEGNRVEDNGRVGIDFEASIGATIRNNTVRRSAGDAVFISMSQNVQIYNNVLDANVGGIEYFLNCASLSYGEDVKNNAAYANTVVVGTQSYAYASAFSSTGCTAAQQGAYLNGSKNLTFSRNTYRVPSVTGRYLLWGGWKYWNEWQGLGYDLDGSISQ